MTVAAKTGLIRSSQLKTDAADPLRWMSKALKAPNAHLIPA